MSRRHWYFAYGSNMQSATFRGRRGIEYTRAVVARAPGWRLVIDKPPLFSVGESFANIVRDERAEVLGVVYEVGDDDLAHIELTEGVLIDNYRRIEVALEPLDEALRSEIASAQTLVSDKRDPTLRPSRRYMDCLISGAAEHGLPADYVEGLRAIEVGAESDEAKRLRPMIDRYMRKGSS